MGSDLMSSDADRRRVLAVVADADKSFTILIYILDDSHRGPFSVWMG